MDDDLYALYAAIGQDVLFVSNDEMGDKRNLVPNTSFPSLLNRWQLSHQVQMIRTHELTKPLLRVSG